MRIKFDDIIINDSYKATKPSEKKLAECKAAYEEGVLDRDIVVNERNVLTDGYVLYCVMKEAGYKGDVDVVVAKSKTTYVFGKHNNDDKERVWYINMSFTKVKEKIGHLAQVETSNGINTIMITRVERLSEPPVKGEIRKVVRL